MTFSDALSRPGVPPLAEQTCRSRPATKHNNPRRKSLIDEAGDANLHKRPAVDNILAAPTRTTSHAQVVASVFAEHTFLNSIRCSVAGPSEASVGSPGSGTPKRFYHEYLCLPSCHVCDLPTI